MTNCGRRNSMLVSTMLLLQLYPLVCQAWGPLKPLSIDPLSIRRKRSNLFKRVLHRKIALPFELSSSNNTDEDLDVLRSENSVLRQTIRELEEENQNLKRRNRIVLESFEGEPSFFDQDFFGSSGITLSGNEITQDELWCDVLEDGRYLLFGCWIVVDGSNIWMRYNASVVSCSFICHLPPLQTNAPSNLPFPSRMHFAIALCGWSDYW